MSQLKIVLLLSYFCVATISATIITPALPQIEISYTLNHGSLEWIISIFLLGYVVGQLVYGYFSNLLGCLNALRIGLIINLLGILVCIISFWLLSYELLLIGRLITGLGSASGLSCSFILINELLTKEQAKYTMSYASVSFSSGIGIAVIVGGLITQYLHWKYCFVFLTIHGIVMLVLTWLLPKVKNPTELLKPTVILSGYYKALRNFKLIIFSFSSGCLSTVSYCCSAAAPVFAYSVLNLTPDVYGLWNIVNMVGMFSSGFLSSYLIKTVGIQQTLLIGIGCFGMCLISLIFISMTTYPHAVWFFVTTMFLFLFSGLLFSTGSFIASNAIEDKASASSMMSFISMGAAVIAVIVMGYLPLKIIYAFTITLLIYFTIVSILILIFYTFFWEY